MLHRGFLLLMALVAVLCCTQCQQEASLRTPRAVRFVPDPRAIVPRSMSKLAREANIKARILPRNSPQRRAAKRLNPRFITIHSTANHGSTSTAMQHSRALCNGAFTDRSWHLTVDQFMVVQNLPLTETGWHAGNAAGNRNSIGIEMCESENSRQNHFRTWERAAKLTAVLMKRYGLNLRHVVPHYHWTRKNCPAPLLDGGRPGVKWAWFISRVDYYYRCINGGKPNR